MLFSLRISPGNPFQEHLTGQVEPFNQPFRFFALTGVYLRFMRPLMIKESVPAEHDVVEALEKFTKLLTGHSPIEVPCDAFCGSNPGAGFAFLAEAIALTWAINRWLFPEKIPYRSRGFLKTEERLTADLAMSDTSVELPPVAYNLYKLFSNTPETARWLRDLDSVGMSVSWDHPVRFWREWTRINYMFRMGKTGGMRSLGWDKLKKTWTSDQTYSTDSLLPLVWAEIAYAIDKNMFAAQCAVCGAPFALKSPQARAVYLCPDKICRKARREEIAGGAEKLRENDCTRQRVCRARKAAGVKVSRDRKPPAR